MNTSVGLPLPWSSDREPRFALWTDDAAVLAGDHRVETDEPHGKIIDDVVQEFGVLVQVPMTMAKGFAHHVAPVVIARNDEHG